jgi:hypothetical protein
MYKFFLTVFVLSALLHLQLFSQSNYLKGYVLKTETDTIYGEIENNFYYNNSKYCDFIDEQGDELRFYPKDIYGYQFINGKHYISKTISFKNDNRITVFCEYLIKGRLDIYFYQDEKLTNYYFAAKDTLPLEELKYYKEVFHQEGKIYQRQSKLYLKTLGKLTNDAPQVHVKLNKINEPNHENLIWFAKNYHDKVCNDESCIIYEKKIPLEFMVRTKIGIQKFFWGGDNTKNKFFSNYNISLLLQQPIKNENIYIGLGYKWTNLSDSLIDKRFYNQIPLSINYINHKMGLSPVFSYEFDLKTGFVYQSLNLGLKYQWSKTALFVDSDICYILPKISKPIYISLNLGMIIKI